MVDHPAGRPGARLTPTGALTCPLCDASAIRDLTEVRGRRYLRCDTCFLTFLTPGQRPAADAERARYETHRNDPGDPGYRAFLERLATPLALRLQPGAEGLDYGAGPGPTLSLMLAERGFRMRIYDPFFAPDDDALARDYDFITCTETVEHFFQPGRVFERLDRLLRPGGWLGIMTGILTDDERFASWWYVRDLTHVCFFRVETMQWIADRFQWTMENPVREVFLFHKPLASEENL